MRRAGSSLRSAATHREMLRFISGSLCQCSLDRFQPRAVHTCAKRNGRERKRQRQAAWPSRRCSHAADRYACRRAGWNSFHSTRWFRIHAVIEDCRSKTVPTATTLVWFARFALRALKVSTLASCTVLRSSGKHHAEDSHSGAKEKAWCPDCVVRCRLLLRSSADHSASGRWPVPDCWLKTDEH